MTYEKFSRQMMLPWISTKGQKKLSESHVVVVGAGGLGCPLLLYLSASGIGKITVIDHDTISTSNLHRQILFTHHDLGRAKVDVVQEKLSLCHPDTTIIGIHARLDTALAEKICTADLVIDGTDRFLSKYILSELCPTLLTASVVGMAGYVMALTPDLPMRTVFPKLPAQSQTCDGNGILGSVAGMMGCFLATEAIKIILHHECSVMHRMVHINFDRLYFSSAKFSSKLSQTYTKLPKFEFIKDIKNCTNIVIDVREKHEVHKEEFTNSLLSIPLSQLEIEKIKDIKNPIFKCKTGHRAEYSALKMGLDGLKSDRIGILI